MKHPALLIARVIATLVVSFNVVAQGVPGATPPAVGEAAGQPAKGATAQPAGAAAATTPAPGAPAATAPASRAPAATAPASGGTPSQPAASSPETRRATNRPPASSVVHDDDWSCTFLAKSFDWLRLELNISVLSTYRLMNCTPFGLDELTTASAAAQLVTASDFIELVKGGSHQPLMDVNLTPALAQYYSVSNLKVAPAGVIRIGLWEVLRRVKTISAIDLITSKSYMRLRYESHTSFIWNPGTLVHRLVDPQGTTYIMSGYTRGVHPDLRKEDLINLKTQLQMPPGWRFESYFLNRTVKIEANDINNNTLHMLFDDLNNRYFEYKE